MEPEVTRRVVLKRDIPWETYMTAKLITGTGLQLLRRYDHRPENVQAALLDENGVAYVKLFVGILRDISKEDTVEYVLALIDDILSGVALQIPDKLRDAIERSCLMNYLVDFNVSQAEDVEDLFRHFCLVGCDDAYIEDICPDFLPPDRCVLRFPCRMLSKRKWFIQETSCKILTLVISARPSEDIQDDDVYTKNEKQPISDFDKTLGGLVDWLSSQLRHPSHSSRAVPTAVSSLATLLRERKVRSIFLKSGGIKLLSNLISPASTQQNIQLLYEATLSVWLLTFYNPAVEALIEVKVVPRLVEVVKLSTKEKVARVALMSLKNLVKLGNCGSELVELGFLKIIQNLRLQAWTDEDLNQALDSLETTLKESTKNLNSFDRYKQEVFSGTLEWTSVHKDPIFWRENYKKFEDDDYQVLRILITILQNSQDSKTLAVACQDISQFIGNHPTGRGIISDLKAKEQIMRLMANDNPEVAREALLCVQKILLSAKYVSYMQ